MELKACPNAEAIFDRYEAWWNLANETPLVTCGIHPAIELRREHWGPVAAADWMDFDRRIELFDERAMATPAFAENLPVFDPNLGPDVLSTIYGSDIEFGEGTGTSWVHPICSTVQEVLALQPSLEAPLWREAMRFVQMAAEAGQGRWMTAYPDLHCNADLLVCLAGPENLAMEVLDDPEGFDAALEAVHEPAMAAYRQSIEPLLAIGQPTLNWMATPVRGRHHVPSCDFCGMVSGEVFEASILPRIRRECALMDHSIFHLDGPNALRHLDALLDCPDIDAIQWVYGAGAGPALRWMEVYQRIQAAGKGMMVCCESAEDAIELSRVLRPEGVLYAVGIGATVEEAEALRAAICRAA